MKSEFFFTHPEETQAFGQQLGRDLPLNSIIAFFGELGAGKTTLIKGLAAGAANIDPREVSSPTFTYLNIYEGVKTVYHFDLYRLRSQEEFLAMGFDEYFTAGGITCLEWSERIASILPPQTLILELAHAGETGRKVSLIKR
jgi:tRNA threonylcarbamoyladenosine biosynthesis protein TsaE